MAFTLAQLEALESAIALGVTRVKYQDKEQEYRSLKEMRELRAQIRRELGMDKPKILCAQKFYVNGSIPSIQSSIRLNGNLVESRVSDLIPRQILGWLSISVQTENKRL